ncbi:MAG: hypothetical protein ACD_76C00076G0001 [uncultured bacterium]|nr:MAG: hypothetical protein ACD_76C00076G0001 [uncultured bacterium]HBD05304.1 hypothetical protein [Candidatus Uhrbacteria bacterium]
MFQRGHVFLPDNTIAFMQASFIANQYSERARDTVSRAIASHPSLKSLLDVPQSPKHHAEGPYLYDHIELGLASLYAILDGKIDLLAIDEFRSMRGYEAEISELQETIKERAASMEAFLLIHDLGKLQSISFTSSGKGKAHGFPPRYIRASGAFRAELFANYQKLFGKFVHENSQMSLKESYLRFYDEYAIDIHYEGHASALLNSELKNICDCICEERGVRGAEIDLVRSLSLRHDLPLKLFRKSRASLMEIIIACATKDRFDSDDYIDSMQAVMVLDAVFGSRAYKYGVVSVEIDTTKNFLISEHDYAPSKSSRAGKRAEIREKQRVNNILKQAGLDGKTVSQIAEVSPGPKLGELMTEIQSAVRYGSPFFVKSSGEEVLLERIRKARTLFESR